MMYISKVHTYRLVVYSFINAGDEFVYVIWLGSAW